MKLPSITWSSPWLLAAVVAAGSGLAAANHQTALGLLIIALAVSFRWWRAGELTLARLQADTWLWLGGWAAVLVITLNPNRVSQTVMILLLGLGWWWLQKSGANQSDDMLAAAFTQGMVLWALFLAAAVWHWSGLAVLVLAWSSAWLIGRRALAGSTDRAAEVLALAWALIVAECSWIFSLWLVNYIIFGGILIVPQPALVITALGYCLSGIYLSHRRSQLSRSRLVEYLMIGLIILVIVIAGTKWNGVI